ncbi:MAG: 16S rRNA (cytidine(1402)-2'-O)-methyltransferase [Deltaproteobacteria bacterium]|nr:16S rRNA (cytidine(1402)-2'-O)-methyltransferase [Deltaproteobacteria bacterium]
MTASPNQPGILYVVATPIGNVEDMSPRALRVLSQSPVLACEDTRHTGVLLKRLNVPRGDRRYVAYHDRNESRQAPVLLKVLRDGVDVALVSNAGTPLVSDPGYRLVTAAREQGIDVVPIPGPCAAATALSAAGLPSDRFTFFGFPPVKAGRRRRLLSGLGPDQGTCIFYVPARSLEKLLVELADAHPDAMCVIAREMTKLYEEFVRGTPDECLERFENRTLKGEVTLLINLSGVSSSA